MKKMNKTLTLILGLSAAFTLLCGNVLAMNIVTDNADKIGVRIDVLNGDFYLNSVSNENKLTNNHNGTWSTGEITANYGDIFQVVDEDGNSVGSSFYVPTEGTYVVTFTHALEQTSVDVISQFVYFNFLPMAGGNQAGRVWNEFYCYAWKNGSNPLIQNADYPGVAMTKVNDNGLYKAEIPGDADKVLFNNHGDTNDHMIKTEDLDYDFNTPMFACTSKTDLSVCVAGSSPVINSSSSFDYYLHTSHNEWAEKSKAYGFEQTEDANQYLLRCYFNANDEFVIRDNVSSWWNKNNLGTATNEWLDTNGDNILIKAADYYTIYFKPNDNGGRIYITKG